MLLFCEYRRGCCYIGNRMLREWIVIVGGHCLMARRAHLLSRLMSPRN